MKKNISINISGIIFHIEEDGYDSLRKYLDSISRYFASFEDSSEILADIESRIAEIFLSKLNEGKQVITAEDVKSLITTMGSVRDFQAAEEQELTPASGGSTRQEKEEPSSASEEEEKEPRTSAKPQQLLRDQKRKILGGVCSGIANYFEIDPVWIRLIFALLAFAYGITVLVYIIMWIVVPGSFDLEEPKANKRMFRDGERKVIGGVSGGVAAYFGMDIIAVRLLFVLFTIFFGVGFIIYIVLWIALPEAVSITDRMEMQGQPVTLSNIESNIKKNLNLGSEQEESALTKIVLFPFRLIGILLSVLGKILVPLLEVFRVAIGIVVVLLGISLVFTAIIAGGVMIGLFSASAFTWPAVSYHEVSMPLEVFTNSFSGWLVFAAFVAALVPAILITLMGVSIIAKRFIFGPSVGWALFVLFFVSVAMLSVSIPRIIYSFKEEGEHKVEDVFTLSGKTAVLHINEVGMDDYHAASLSLRGHESEEFKLVQVFKAQGATKQTAIENARMVNYNIDVRDSTIVFDSNIEFKKDAIFRAQRLDMILYIPFDYPFVMDESTSRFISQHVDYEYMEGNTWTMTDRGLTCLSCPKRENESGITDQFGLSEFDELDIRGVFDVRIIQGDEYAVELIGPASERDKYSIFRSGHTLVVEYEGRDRKFDWDDDILNLEEIRINITLPELEKIEAEGYGKIQFDRFTFDDLDIYMRGPVKLRGEVQARDLIINLTGKSEVELSGRADNLDADIQFASKLRAYNLEVIDAVVEVNGASSAKVNVSGTVEIEEGLASDVDVRGHPRVIKRD
jgi:phage shock protein PspC (stress-responsive transcriptional regulator)